MEARALTKFNRGSAQKATLVAREIRHKSVEEALTILENSPNKAADGFKKTLDSAIANATENHGMMTEDLWVKIAVANEGPTMKRYRARAKGRADHKYRRTSHLEVVVSDEKRGK